MKLAIATENGNVSPHFGHCEMFTIVEIENGKVRSKEEMGSAHHDCGSLPILLGEKGVQCIITGGIGGRPMQIFELRGIRVIAGVIGAIDDVIKTFISGNLYSGQNLCSPDHHEHHGPGGCARK